VQVGLAFAAASPHLDDAQEYQAEPEVYRQTQIYVRSDVLGGSRQVGHHQKIENVPPEYGDQGMHEIRHRR
jgi:hypothetical protein